MHRGKCWIGDGPQAPPIEAGLIVGFPFGTAFDFWLVGIPRIKRSLGDPGGEVGDGLGG